jgi:hypothetical protein
LKVATKDQRVVLTVVEGRFGEGRDLLCEVTVVLLDRSFPVQCHWTRGLPERQRAMCVQCSLRSDDVY